MAQPDAGGRGEWQPLPCLPCCSGISLWSGPRSEDDAPPVAQQMTQVDQDRLEATVAFKQVAWGTKLHLTCTYSGDDWGDDGYISYAMVVHTSDGASRASPPGALCRDARSSSTPRRTRIRSRSPAWTWS